ncbi:DUF898 family protein [Pontivivens ytuae]|uniref:DUF898 family protein n=1 Tax=Pontivivens ytuae TaxID=2789856 RepID=A0A7S9LS38_9RHOB|nr:DUF898 family protein [Pontivivens ytuae]QPH54287.1 DUF898 family protein [Pontivivens ytuae]
MTTQSSQAPVAPRFVGESTPLFWLAARTLLFTVLTLGIYRFWMRTKMRQYYWGAVEVEGEGFEYTGTGLEKLLGFLVAIVVLAIILAIFNLGLYVVGLSVFDGNQFAGTLTLLPLIPLTYYAQYRARRYVLSRTRFRGIRFGAEPAAWRYVGVALVQTLITVLTLGVLAPRQHWKLEKFRSDRTYYGDLRLRQGGRWQALMRPWLGVILSVVATTVLIIGATGADSPIAAVAFGVIGYLALILFYVRYQIVSFRILTGQKEAGPIRLQSGVRTGRVIGIVLLGTFLVSVILSVIGAVLFAVMNLLVGSTIDFTDPEAITTALAGGAALLGFVAIYLLLIVLGGAFSEIFVSMPLVQHYVETLRIENAEALADVRQRAEDDFMEADGFADALDVGAAF